MSDSPANLTTKNRPSRNDYPLTPAGDLGFAQALVVWQGDELDRLTAEVAELKGILGAACNVLEAAGYIEAATSSRATLGEQP